MATTRASRSVAAASVLLIAGCATAPGQPGSGHAIQQTFASEDPCSNNARNIGVVGGAVLGALLGNAMGDNKGKSRLIGAALGGMVGGLIGADMDRKRCELSKVAKQYNLDITFANIESQGDVAPIGQTGSSASTSQPSATGSSPMIGSTVTVRPRDDGTAQFESGSEKLTPAAQAYFAAIAKQYAPSALIDSQPDQKGKEEARKQLAQRRILLIGHTDDTGSSQLNADLSERRARAVAAFLSQQGIPEDSLYFQGAGETLPIADNRTENGRSANRRVEIIEVADETGFKKYLEKRKPQYAFYRPAPESTQPAHQPPLPKATGREQVASAPTPPAQRRTPPPIDFGGAPYSTSLAKIDVGRPMPDKSPSLFSKAYADDSILLSDCTYDRPRAVGSVKSLKDGQAYRTTEHMPLLYGKTWASTVNGHLVVINRLAVLRDGAKPANLPELKVYSDYKPQANKKPSVSEEPEVNTYLVERGVLYRMFPRGDGGLKCMDLLFGTDGAKTAKAGKLIYASGAERYVVDFKPQLQ